MGFIFSLIFFIKINFIKKLLKGKGGMDLFTFFVFFFLLLPGRKGHGFFFFSFCHVFIVSSFQNFGSTSCNFLNIQCSGKVIYKKLGIILFTKPKKVLQYVIFLGSFFR
jgi:hypothetical protein